MPRIPDQLLESVVYLFQTEDDARQGKGAGGTGFLIDYANPTTGDRFWYIVTNVHVSQNGCNVLRINTDDGGVATPTVGDWANHPDGDDVSLAPIDFDVPDDWAVDALVWEDFCPTQERMNELNIGVGDDVLMLGRFTGHSGRQQNQPLARFGNIAMMPGERVKDGRGLEVDAFLVEMRSIPGFSGSPVFVVIGAGSYRGTYGGETKMMPFYSETIGLLGIDTGHKPIMHKVLGPDGRPLTPTIYVAQNSGVAIVAPYTKILDVLENHQVV